MNKVFNKSKKKIIYLSTIFGVMGGIVIFLLVNDIIIGKKDDSSLVVGDANNEKTYIVVLDSQGGNGGDIFIDVTNNSKQLSVHVPSKNKTVMFYYNDGITSSTSYTFSYAFKGYYTEINGKGKQCYDEDGIMTNKCDITNDVTLYAAWDEDNNIILPKINRMGYDLDGWYTESIGGTKIGDGGSTYELTSNINLYAQWKVSGYQIDIDQQDATTISETGVNAIYGSAMPNLTMIPKKEHTIKFNYNGSGQENKVEKFQYKFLGVYQYRDGEGKKYYNADGTSATNWDVAGSTTLFVDWSEECISLPDAVWDGKVLLGWYTSASRGTKVGNVGDNYCPDMDVTLYARWKKK